MEELNLFYSFKLYTSTISSVGDRVIIVTTNGEIDTASLPPRYPMKQYVIPKIYPNRAVYVSAGYYGTAVILENGDMYLIGINCQRGAVYNCGLFPFDKIIVSVSVGYCGLGFITENGELYMFGKNTDGELGVDGGEYADEGGDDLHHIYQNQGGDNDEGDSDEGDNDEGDNYEGDNDEGDNYQGDSDEGDNYQGDSDEGDNDEDFIPEIIREKYISTPTLVPFDEPVIQLSCSSNHTAVVTKSGKLYTFGQANLGQLGIGQAYPLRSKYLVDIKEKVVKVNCGNSGTYAITDEGLMYTFGNGCASEDAEDLYDYHYYPTIVLCKEKIIDIDNGESFCGGITEHGRLFTMSNGLYPTLPFAIIAPIWQPIRSLSFKGSWGVIVNEEGNVFMVTTHNRIIGQGNALKFDGFYSVVA